MKCMGIFMRKKEVREVEKLLESVDNYMSNNYKDQVKIAYKEAIDVYRRNCESGAYDEKEKLKLGRRLNEYAETVSKMSHADMSRYLAEVRASVS